jgi:hypothetical protein
LEMGGLYIPIDLDSGGDAAAKQPIGAAFRESRRAAMSDARGDREVLENKCRH